MGGSSRLIISSPLMIANVVIILISSALERDHILRSAGGPKSQDHVPNRMRIHYRSQFNHIAGLEGHFAEGFGDNIRNV